MEPGSDIQVQETTPIPSEEPSFFENAQEAELTIAQIPSPTPTPIISTVTDWNPYQHGIVPFPKPASNDNEPLKNRTSVLKNYTNNSRQILNASYSDSVSLSGYAYGKELNITKGPFSVIYTIHPAVENPLLVWVKITVLDPWQNLTAEGGYNRNYSSEGTKTMTVYREGRFYLIIEGEYASVDYTVKTGDPTPEPTPVQENLIDE